MNKHIITKIYKAMLADGLLYKICDGRVIYCRTPKSTSVGISCFDGILNDYVVDGGNDTDSH